VALRKIAFDVEGISFGTPIIKDADTAIKEFVIANKKVNKRQTIDQILKQVLNFIGE